MAFGGTVVVGREEGMRRGEVWPRTLGQPPDGTNHALVPLLTFEEYGAVVGFVRFRACVDGKAGSIWGGVGGDVTFVSVVILDKMSSKSRLAEVNRNFPPEA
jgi:hypothetical protein